MWMKAPLSYAIASCFMLGLSSSVSAYDVSDIVSQAKEIESNAHAIVGDLDIMEPNDDVLKLAEEIMESSIAASKSGMPQVADHFDFELPDTSKSEWDEGEWVDILVSRSLAGDLLETIKGLDGSKIQVRFVFRGIEEGQKITDAFTDYGKWTKGLESPPGAVLDPTIFRDQGVTSVPHMIFRRDGEVVASVTGLSNPQWLVDAVERGETGHLGTRGPVQEISERDLIAVMQERAAALDMEEKKKETIRTYWERADFISLTPAPDESRRLIDPSIVVPDGLRDANGKEILPPGSVINPLDMLPFNMRLVIFNPNRKAEMEWVGSLEKAPGLNTIYMATELDRESGWDHLEEVESGLDSAVYLLTPDVSTRFELRHTPSLVTSDGRHFVVDEFKPAAGLSHEN